MHLLWAEGSLPLKLSSEGPGNGKIYTGESHNCVFCSTFHASQAHHTSQTVSYPFLVDSGADENFMEVSEEITFKINSSSKAIGGSRSRWSVTM